MSYSLKNNTIVKTDDGDFMIVPIEVCGSNEREDIFSFGAMFIDSEGEYHFEIQLVDEDYQRLIDRLDKEIGKVLDIIEPETDRWF